MTGEKDAPAAMPGEEDVARALRPEAWARCDAAGVTDTGIGNGITIGDLSARRSSLDDARAILDLFAPILAKKERLAQCWEKECEERTAIGKMALDRALEPRAINMQRIQRP